MLYEICKKKKKREIKIVTEVPLQRLNIAHQQQQQQLNAGRPSPRPTRGRRAGKHILTSPIKHSKRRRLAAQHRHEFLSAELRGRPKPVVPRQRGLRHPPRHPGGQVRRGRGAGWHRSCILISFSSRFHTTVLYCSRRFLC